LPVATLFLKSIGRLGRPFLPRAPIEQLEVVRLQGSGIGPPPRDIQISARQNCVRGLRWLAAPTPNLDEARSALERIIRDAKRAGDVIAQIPALVEKSALTKAQLNLSEMIQEVLAITNPEARQHRVWARTELTPGLPPVQG
jgi:hypothetical protein